MEKHWFAQGSGVDCAEKVSISKAFQRLKMRKKGPFPTFPQFLSRNASIFALKRSITFNPDGRLESDQDLGRKRRTRPKKLQWFHFSTFSRTTGKTPSRFTKKDAHSRSRKNGSRSMSFFPFFE